MWYCDKPIPQQRLAQSLGELHLLYAPGKKDEAFIRFSKAFWKVICIQWYRIDQHRIDKFLLLIRRCLHFQIKYLFVRNWDEELIDAYIAKVLKKIPLSGDKKVYNGIPFHIIDILLDEWVKVCASEEDADDDDDEDEDDRNARIAESVQNTPLSKFVDIFQELRANKNNIKILREKIKEDILGDERLYQWSILAAEDKNADVEEEWTGF